MHFKNLAITAVVLAAASFAAPAAAVTNLIKNGISYQEALEMPEPRAVWLSAAFSIAGGAKLEFLSPEMEAEIDAFLSAQQSMKPPA